MTSLAYVKISFLLLPQNLFISEIYLFVYIPYSKDLDLKSQVKANNGLRKSQENISEVPKVSHA